MPLHVQTVPTLQQKIQQHSSNLASHTEPSKKNEWNALKNEIPRHIWQTIADSIAQSNIITLEAETPPVLKLDSVLNAIYTRAATFEDSLINAMKFVGWHTIAANIVNSQDNILDTPFTALDVAQQFQCFENNNTPLPAAECAEYASYLGNILKAANITSYSYYLADFHTMQLAFDNKQNKYYLLDAQYLRYLSDENGNFIDIRKAQEKLKQVHTQPNHNVQWKSIS